MAGEVGLEQVPLQHGHLVLLFILCAATASSAASSTATPWAGLRTRAASKWAAKAVKTECPHWIVLPISASVDSVDSVDSVELATSQGLLYGLQLPPQVELDELACTRGRDRLGAVSAAHLVGFARHEDDSTPEAIRSAVELGVELGVECPAARPPGGAPLPMRAWCV